MIQKIGLIAAIILPLWNIPLIVRIIKRRSSEDISMFWALGVWICLLLIAPSGFTSKDIVWRTYNVVNFVFFSAVTAIVLLYRKAK
ncbi:MAG: hypothetical protein COS99_03130 [Candidatus Omnitrophica bacterium CG07_land_8_20_14_0_80_42_15]|uniref:PQ-loop repeat-containing protein n=1 Tax=Candidatus Aquitaenariimonas noxiae TaxID=1974741 RepID=A0A2J0KTY7_9BACT|nr:MAG: hypothetical protein COS99_03130 [Candidatus Omnitrophica bacterium CG07_land_8_20_14_0_80_42_15]